MVDETNILGGDKGVDYSVYVAASHIVGFQFANGQIHAGLGCLDKGIDDAGGRYFPQAHTYQRGNVHLYAGSAGGDQQANGNKAEQQRQKQYDQNNDNEGKGHFVLTSR